MVEDDHHTLNYTEQPRFKWLVNTAPYPVMQYMEGALTVILSVDFLLRLYLSESKTLFFKSFLVWADVMSLLPIWCMFLMQALIKTSGRTPGRGIWITVIILSYLRTCRVLKILHVIKNYKSIRLIWLTLKKGRRYVYRYSEIKSVVPKHIVELIGKLYSNVELFKPFARC